MLKPINIIFISFISLFNIISTQDCSSTTPTIRYDCFKYATSQQYCCFEKENNNCSPVDKANYTNNSNNSHLDCGITDENYGYYEFEEYHPRHGLELPFLGCGEKNPKKKEDCLEYSEISNSCCFFKDSSGKKGCYYIGRRYRGDLEEKSFTYNDQIYRYECNSYYAFFNFSFVLFLLILFF